MTSYSDTGFLVKLYLEEPESAQVTGGLSEPILLTELTRLELRNAFHLNVFQKKITEEKRRAAWSTFENDIHNGLFTIKLLPSIEHYNLAGSLADRYSATVGCRSLDLLHVAAALLLQVGEMLSFDVRQRTVAVSEGLQVRP